MVTFKKSARPQNYPGGCMKTRIQKCGAVIGGDRLTWRRVGDALTLSYGKSQKPIVQVEPDPRWPGMFRVRSGRAVSDIVNLTRAKDAAVSLALHSLNSMAQEKLSDASYIRFRRLSVGPPRPELPGAPAPPTRLPLRSRR